MRLNLILTDKLNYFVKLNSQYNRIINDMLTIYNGATICGYEQPFECSLRLQPHLRDVSTGFVIIDILLLEFLKPELVELICDLN